VSASTQNQALSALLFLYRHVLRTRLEFIEGLPAAKCPVRLPVVLSQAEVRTVIRSLRGVARLCCLLMYGGGLRVGECVTLRVKDVDLDRCEIVVRGGKGNKDRRVPLPRIALPSLRAHLERVKAAISPTCDAACALRACPTRWASSTPMRIGIGLGGISSQHRVCTATAMARCAATIIT
jgi:integrase